MIDRRSLVIQNRLRKSFGLAFLTRAGKSWFMIAKCHFRILLVYLFIAWFCRGLKYFCTIIVWWWIHQIIQRQKNQIDTCLSVGKPKITSPLAKTLCRRKSSMGNSWIIFESIFCNTVFFPNHGKKQSQITFYTCSGDQQLIPENRFLQTNQSVSAPGFWKSLMKGGLTPMDTPLRANQSTTDSL